MTELRNDVDIVTIWLERIGELDIEAALELVDADFVLELPYRADGGPSRMRGEDAAKFMRVLPKLFARMRFSDVTLHQIVTPGHVIAEYGSDGVTRDGRPYRNTYISMFELRDGRIVLAREYFDPSVIAQAFPATTGD
jgi:ketosteroid isomerase-like protein